MSSISKDQLKSLILKEMSSMKLNEGPREDEAAAEENEKMMRDLNKLVEDFMKAVKQQIMNLERAGRGSDTALDKANLVINMMAIFSQYHQQIQPLTGTLESMINQMQQQQMDQMMQTQGMAE